MQNELEECDFNRISGFIYEKFGIFYGKEKREMLGSKLNRVMYRKSYKNISELIDLILYGNDLDLISDFTNEITTHTTNFFRESNHFQFLKDSKEFILKNNKRITENREIRVWSAGCSTGEEAYSIAMVLHQLLGGNYKIKILATDVSKKVLEIAQNGIYNDDIVKQVDTKILSEYFSKKENMYFVSDLIKSFVFFRYFNLSENFNFQNQFDMIFCRNVIIYFDLPSRQKLINKFHEVLTSGGILFLGHSESLAGISNKFQYLSPTVYLKT